MDEEQQEEKRVVGRDRSKAARGRGGKSQSSARLFSTLWPSSLGVNLMRHNGGEHEIPRFSLIRPQWRFPDKPGRSLFFFCPLHIRTAVFFTTIEPQCHRVLDFPRGLGSAGPEQPKIAPRCRAAWGGRVMGRETPFQSSMPRLSHSHRVGNRRVWRAGRARAAEGRTKRNSDKSRRRRRVVRGVLKLCISTAAAASHALILSIGRKTLLPYSALPF